MILVAAPNKPKLTICGLRVGDVMGLRVGSSDGVFVGSGVGCFGIALSAWRVCNPSSDSISKVVKAACS